MTRSGPGRRCLDGDAAGGGAHARTDSTDYDADYLTAVDYDGE
jgi:hypothetical protein